MEAELAVQADAVPAAPMPELKVAVSEVRGAREDSWDWMLVGAPPSDSQVTSPGSSTHSQARDASPSEVTSPGSSAHSEAKEASPSQSQVPSPRSSADSEPSSCRKLSPRKFVTEERMHEA